MTMSVPLLGDRADVVAGAIAEMFRLTAVLSEHAERRSAAATTWMRCTVTSMAVGGPGWYQTAGREAPIRRRGAGDRARGDHVRGAYSAACASRSAFFCTF